MEGSFKVCDKMVKDGFMPNVVIYNNLILCLCNTKRMSEAIGLFEDMQNNGLLLDDVT